MLAAETAAKRMALPVFAASLTTIIAFFGLTAISGRFGSLIADIPFTVIAVLIASLVECFLILPNHMAHSISVGDSVKWYDLPSHYFNKGFRWFRDNFPPFHPSGDYDALRHVVRCHRVIDFANRDDLERGSIMALYQLSRTIFGHRQFCDGEFRQP